VSGPGPRGGRPAPPVAVTVAGSDSGGGAGIQADLHTFAAMGVFGACAVTAVTAQDTVAVRAVHLVPPDMVLAQLQAVLEDLPVSAAKTGMLGSATTVATVAEVAASGGLPNLVVDPVLAASSGTRFADPAAVDVYRSRLLPAATVVTPNLPEAAALVGDPRAGTGDAEELARRLGDLTDALIVVTGGHAEGAGPDGRSGSAAGAAREVVDVAWDGRQLHRWHRPRVATANSHGTGCTLSAAIAAGLAWGRPALAAVGEAGMVVQRALLGACQWRLGRGTGPLDLFPWELAGAEPAGWEPAGQASLSDDAPPPPPAAG